MSTNKTQFFNLHSWVPEDDFLRSEFNDNFTNIDLTMLALSSAIGSETTARKKAVSAEATARDAAIAAEANARTAAFNSLTSSLNTLSNSKAELFTGVYTGDDTADRTIELGFQPRAVLIMSMDGYVGTYNGYQYGGLCLAGHPLRYHGSGKTGTIIAEITSSGFAVHKANCEGAQLNSSHYIYYYIALK